MSKDNVVSLPSARTKEDGGREAQLELFPNVHFDSRAFTFVDVDDIDERQLIYTLTRNSIEKIIDLRKRPVFDKPKFSHKVFTKYLYARSIDYYEASLVGPETVRRTAGAIDWLTSSTKAGLVVCIIDNDAVEDGLLSHFRRALRASDEYWIEVHPRSIFGIDVSPPVL